MGEKPKAVRCMICGNPFIEQPKDRPATWLSMAEIEKLLIEEKAITGHNTTGICPVCQMLRGMQLTLRDIVNDLAELRLRLLE